MLCSSILDSVAHLSVYQLCSAALEHARRCLRARLAQLGLDVRFGGIERKLVLASMPMRMCVLVLVLM